MSHRLLIGVFGFALFVFAAQVVDAPTRPPRLAGPAASPGGSQRTLGYICWWPLCEWAN